MIAQLQHHHHLVKLFQSLFKNVSYERLSCKSVIINQKPTEFKTMEPEVQKCDLVSDFRTHLCVPY